MKFVYVALFAICGLAAFTQAIDTELIKHTDALNELVDTANKLAKDFVPDVLAKQSDKLKKLQADILVELPKFADLSAKIKDFQESTDASAKMFEQIQLTFMHIRIHNYQELYRHIVLDLVAFSKDGQQFHSYRQSSELDTTTRDTNEKLSKIVTLVYQTDAMIEALTTSGLKIDREAKQLIADNLQKIAADSRATFGDLEAKYLKAVEVVDGKHLDLAQFTTAHYMMDMLKHLEHLGSTFNQLFHRIYKNVAA